MKYAYSLLSVLVQHWTGVFAFLSYFSNKKHQDAPASQQQGILRLRLSAVAQNRNHFSHNALMHHCHQ